MSTNRNAKLLVLTVVCLLTRSAGSLCPSSAEAAAVHSVSIPDNPRDRCLTVGSTVAIECESTVSSIEVRGSSPVPDDTPNVAQYECWAHYTDGSEGRVDADSWSVTRPHSIASDGRLSTGAVTGIETCTITATYARVPDATKPVTVLGTPSSVLIAAGPDDVPDNMSAAGQYVCIAQYDTPARFEAFEVTGWATWQVEPGGNHSISGGSLTTGDVAGDKETIAIHASFDGVSTRRPKSVTVWGPVSIDLTAVLYKGPPVGDGINARQLHPTGGGSVDFAVSYQKTVESGAVDPHAPVIVSTILLQVRSNSSGDLYTADTFEEDGVWKARWPIPSSASEGEYELAVCQLSWETTHGDGVRGVDGEFRRRSFPTPSGRFKILAAGQTTFRITVQRTRRVNEDGSPWHLGDPEPICYKGRLTFSVHQPGSHKRPSLSSTCWEGPNTGVTPYRNPIPADSYPARAYLRHGGTIKQCVRLNDNSLPPPRSDILVHYGTVPSQSDGCILTTDILAIYNTIVGLTGGPYWPPGSDGEWQWNVSVVILDPPPLSLGARRSRRLPSRHSRRHPLAGVANSLLRSPPPLRLRPASSTSPAGRSVSFVEQGTARPEPTPSYGTP